MDDRVMQRVAYGEGLAGAQEMAHKHGPRGVPQRMRVM